MSRCGEFVLFWLNAFPHFSPLVKRVQPAGSSAHHRAGLTRYTGCITKQLHPIAIMQISFSAAACWDLCRDVKTLLLMHRLHGRALFYLPHLLVECSCGSGELEICSGQKWAAQMYLMRLQLTTRGLNYGEIKVLISPKWAQKKKSRSGRSQLPSAVPKSFCCPRFRNKHARSDCLRCLSRTCRKQRGKHHKDFDNPVWDGKLNQQQFLMQFLTQLYDARSRRSKPTPDVNWVTVPVNAALYISLLIRCK